MSLRRLLLIAAILVVIGTIVILRPASTAGPCNVLDGIKRLPELPEASGLAIGRRNPGVLWSHNDSGNGSVLFAVDGAGIVRAKVHVPVQMRDWEDISAARCPSGDCLYLADIGDNALERRRIQIYRIPEPALDDIETGPPEVFNATYVDGNHNAEAAFVIGDDLIIIARDRSGRIYRSFMAVPGGDLSLQRIGQLGLVGVTDAEASPDGESVVVRTSDEAAFYRTASLLAGETNPYLRIRLDPLREVQGEGVAFDGKEMLYLASEGRFWSRAGRLLTLHCMGLAPPRGN